MCQMWLLLVLCLLVLASGVQRASDQQEQRRASRGVHNNRRIDEKVANMDVNTRKRVLAMKQSSAIGNQPWKHLIERDQ